MKLGGCARNLHVKSCFVKTVSLPYNVLIHMSYFSFLAFAALSPYLRYQINHRLSGILGLESRSSFRRWDGTSRRGGGSTEGWRTREGPSEKWEVLSVVWKYGHPSQPGLFRVR